MDEALLESFLNTFDDRRFPEGFLQGYEALECLAHNEMGETLLVKARDTGLLCIAKCYPAKHQLSKTVESDLLKSLDHTGLPSFIGEYKNDEMLCVLREYVEGIPLNQYAAENRISQEQAVDIVLQLCDILSYLHGQKPAIIHRDIKPQNIIINKKGNIKLIDFGISRKYDETVKEDTICFGTRHFAAPEQYGFAQTDCRADIFSLGVLLGWLLMGESDYKQALAGINDRQLLKILKKCTEFAPERRYEAADKIKYELLRSGGHRQRTVLKWIIVVSFCFASLSIGFVLGRCTDLFRADISSDEVHFEEPLIEKAVRLSLKMNENEPITDTDLLNVTELFIYGDQAAGSFEEFEAIGIHMINNDGQVKNGGLSSLEDLKQLRNLRRLNIALENISDLTPLAGLYGLERILIKHDPLEDLSPLGSLTGLRELFLYDTRVSELTSLKDCILLENIEVGASYITSMSAFDGIKDLKYLSMVETPLNSISGIEAFTGLEQLRLSDVADGDLSPLLKLPKLKQVKLGEVLRSTAETELKEANFEIQYE